MVRLAALEALTTISRSVGVLQLRMSCNIPLFCFVLSAMLFDHQTRRGQVEVIDFLMSRIGSSKGDKVISASCTSFS